MPVRPTALATASQGRRRESVFSAPGTSVNVSVVAPVGDSVGAVVGSVVGAVVGAAVVAAVVSSVGVVLGAWVGSVSFWSLGSLEISIQGSFAKAVKEPS